MSELINEILAAQGLSTEVITFEPVSGGDINKAFYIVTADGPYFIKMNDGVDRDFFEKESTGLKLIRQADAINAPEPIGFGAIGNGTSYLIMEWIEGSPGGSDDSSLGRRLAGLHKTIMPWYGLDKDNYIGLLHQPNGRWLDWCDYYRQQRIGHQMQIAEKNGKLPLKRRKKMERLLDRLDGWVPRQPAGSLLHGDLWGGNWIAGPGGEPYVIDPAVFYGHREMDIAFSELFGGFSDAFYREYDETYPLDYGYTERKPIYQLFYLLVHLNLFGESYGSAVDRILNRYADIS
ncbi:fructosamine kinase family protein [Bacillus marinisedimentorum]|uniref:fructosamine kinase family protein n=1 Tax=Bacillus marinisedimentorum TaxID=1821260 RepID=UPI0007E1D1BE|nr:fructosamine kinase family protein [Bacillus marinisedimentorum]